MATDYKNLYIYFGRGNGKSTYSTNVIERINEEMTMDQMVRHLERRGFRVIKEYDGRSGSYIFTITKDGVAYSEDFKYPASGDWRYKDEKQKEFLKNIVENFYIYTTRKEEEKMANAAYLQRKAEMEGKDSCCLKWSVESMEYDSGNWLSQPYTKVVIYGRGDGIPTTDLQDFIERRLNGAKPKTDYTNCWKCPKPNFAIKDVIFNPPATIVFWEDGTKTVVKAGEFDTYDPEKGLAMAITKKALGNQGSYYNTIRKWLDKYQEEAEKAFSLVKKIFDDYMKSAPIGTVKSVRETEDGLFAEIEPTKNDVDWVE